MAGATGGGSDMSFDPETEADRPPPVPPPDTERPSPAPLPSTAEESPTTGAGTSRCPLMGQDKMKQSL